MTSSTDVQVPVHQMDLQYGDGRCTRSAVCDKYIGQFGKRMVGRYVGRGATFRRQILSAVLDIREFDYERYMKQVGRIHKGSALRHARKADRQGLYCKQFAWKNHIPDIVDINTSKEVRSGGVMTKAYQRTIVDMGGPPSRRTEVAEPACLHHCTYCWGVFQPVPGHRQGEIVTDERLVGYIKFKRQGSLAIYTSILGHGDMLNHGIMYRLHFAVMRWLAANAEDRLRGLEFVLYGGHESKAAGLRQWKKRTMFEPAYLVLDHLPTPDDGS